MNQPLGFKTVAECTLDFALTDVVKAMLKHDMLISSKLFPEMLEAAELLLSRKAIYTKRAIIYVKCWNDAERKELN